MATWICYPRGVFTDTILLCNEHKREREREERKQGRCKLEQIEREVKSALQDVDPSDIDAFYERCGQILDDIHADHC
jgi:hypothetical protein